MSARRRVRAVSVVVVSLAVVGVGHVAAVPSATPQTRWTDQFGSSQFDIGLAVAASAAGGFVTGYTAGAIPGQSFAGETDAFLRRYAPNGTVMWTRQFGTAATDTGSAVAATGTAAFVAGSTTGALRGANLGLSDAYVRRYSANGTVAWTRQFGSTMDDRASAISVSGSRLYVAGTTAGTLAGQTNEGDSDAFVRAYDLEGTLLWTHQFGTSAPDQADAVAATASGAYVAGSTDATLFGQTSQGFIDAFVRRYDDQGNIAWTRQFGTSGIDRATAVSTAGSALYVGGYGSEAFPGQPFGGVYDAFIRRYTTNGAAVWTRQFGGEGIDDLKGLSARPFGVYAAGTAGTSVYGQTSAGGIDGFAVRYTPGGAVVWARQYGTGNSESARGIAAAPSGVYTAGNTDGALPGENAAGGVDVFARRFVSYRPDLTISQSAASGYAGNDLYNTTSANQTQSAVVARGNKRSFYVKAANDGDATDSFTIDGCAPTAAFPVAYFAGTANVTDKVVAGTYKTSAVAPGVATTVRAVVSVANNANLAAVRACKVTATSTMRPALVDAVTARVEVKD